MLKLLLGRAGTGKSTAILKTMAAEASRRPQVLIVPEQHSHDLILTNKQTVFQRQSEHERVLVAVNADSEPYWAHFDAGCGRAVDLITGQEHDFGGAELPPYSVFFWKCE